jgi:hypothetical protein
LLLTLWKDKILKRFFLFITFLIFLVSFFSCTTKNKEVVVKEEKADDITEDILEIYNKLIDGIKHHDFEKISSCYTEDANYIYGDNTPAKYVCFNSEKKVNGINDIISQYKFLFKKYLLNKIEFEVYKIDRNSKNPSITFINVWQNSDDDLIELIEFKKINNQYFISNHLVQKKQ